MFDGLTSGELNYCRAIRAKDESLRTYLAQHSLDKCASPDALLNYLNGMKSALGNLNNDLSFVATLLAKNYLAKRFEVASFDAAGKPQGAAGVDIEAVTPEGKTIVGELKTTKPYQPNFGAAQRNSILKDLKRLADSSANFRFMFVIDEEAFIALCKPSLASRAPGVEIVNLVSGDRHICGGAQ